MRREFYILHFICDDGNQVETRGVKLGTSPPWPSGWVEVMLFFSLRFHLRKIKHIEQFSSWSLNINNFARTHQVITRVTFALDPLDTCLKMGHRVNLYISLRNYSWILSFVLILSQFMTYKVITTVKTLWNPSHAATPSWIRYLVVTEYVWRVDFPWWSII